MAVSSEPRALEKRLLLGEGEIGPATVPRTRPASSNAISDAELADLNMLRKTLSFQADDRDDDSGRVPQQLPAGVTRDSGTGAYRYADTADAQSNGDHEAQLQKLRDIQSLESQLAYFQTMRRQAESLVQQLSTNTQDDDAVGDLSQLEEKKMQLDMLQGQLQQLRQMQVATEGDDIGDDSSSTSAESVERDAGDDDEGSRTSEATIVPGVQDPSEEAAQLQNELAELSKKRAILNGLRGKLDSLRNAASVTMSNATDSTALPELQEKKEMLEILQGQLAALRRLQQSNYDEEAAESARSSGTSDYGERQDSLTGHENVEQMAAASAKGPTAAMLQQYATHPGVREKLQTLMQLQDKLKSLRQLQSNLETQQMRDASGHAGANMNHSYNKIVEVTDGSSDEQDTAAAAENGEDDTSGADDGVADTALAEKRRMLQLLEERLALLKQLHHAPQLPRGPHERGQALHPESHTAEDVVSEGRAFHNQFADDGDESGGSAREDSDTSGDDDNQVPEQLAQLFAKREKLQSLHRKLLALKEAQRLQHQNEAMAAPAPVQTYDYLDADGSEEHYVPELETVRAPTTVADTQRKELHELQQQLAAMRALKQEAMGAQSAVSADDGNLVEQLKDLQAKKALLEGLKGRLTSILDHSDGPDDTRSAPVTSHVPPLPPRMDSEPDARFDKYASRERLHVLRAKHGVPSLREEVLSHASTHGSQSTSEPNVSQISSGEDPVVRLQRLVDEVERQQDMIQRMSDMYVDDADADAPDDNDQRFVARGPSPPALPPATAPPALAPTLQVKDIDMIHARSRQQRRQREVAFDTASVMRQYSNDESSQYGNDWTTATASVDLEPTRASDVLHRGQPHGLTDEETFGLKANVRMAGGGEDEVELQNMKLAVLYSESLHVDRRESFLRTFFKFFGQPATAARAFQLSFDAYGPGSAHDDVPDSASVLLRNVRRNGDGDSDRAMNQFPDPDASIIANVDPSDDARMTPLTADVPFLDYRWVEDQVERGNPDAPRSHSVAATAPDNSPTRDGVLFEELKDAIYREVAVFITCNESRPHFLLAFFRLAQCLTADHLRGAAVDALQAVVGTYADDEDDDSELAEDDADDDLEDFRRRTHALQGSLRGTEDLDLINDHVGAALEFHGGLDTSEYEADLPYDCTHAPRRPGTAEHNNRSYDYEEMAEFVTDVPTDDDVREGAEHGSASDGLAVQFQAEIEDNKDIIVQLSRHLRELRGDGGRNTHLVFTEAIVGAVASRVAASIDQRTGDDADSVEGAAQQVSHAIRKALQRYVGSSVADTTEDVLRDVSDILYDVMIFNKVIQQVDKSYLDEISELQTTRTDLDLEVDQLQKQREEDLAKLLRERRELLKKMKWDAERDSDRLDKKRDDEFAQECEFPDRGDTTQDGASTNVVVELTPSEARLSGDSDDDGEPSNASHHGGEPEVAAAAAALEFMNNIMKTPEDNLVGEDD